MWAAATAVGKWCAVTLKFVNTVLITVSALILLLATPVYNAVFYNAVFWATLAACAVAFLVPSTLPRAPALRIMAWIVTEVWWNIVLYRSFFSIAYPTGAAVGAGTVLIISIIFFIGVRYTGHQPSPAAMAGLSCTVIGLTVALLASMHLRTAIDAAEAARQNEATRSAEDEEWHIAAEKKETLQPRSRSLAAVASQRGAFNMNASSAEEIVAYCAQDSEDIPCESARNCGMLAYITAKQAGCIDGLGRFDTRPEHSACAEYSVGVMTNLTRIEHACGVSIRRATEIVTGMR